MSDKKFNFSAREIAKEMDEATKQVIAGTANVNIGTMTISKFKTVLTAYKYQLDESRFTGKPIENPLVDMS